MPVTTDDIKDYFSAPGILIAEDDFTELLDEHIENGFSEDVTEALADAFKGYLYCDAGEEAREYAKECGDLLDITLDC